jgi:hypothetical protein
VNDLELSIDGLDLRSFSSLKPLEQLERLQRDCTALTDYEIQKRKADDLLRAQTQKKTEQSS